ncbi:ABC transporter substrate-binding protein [Bacillus aquiflavi]|uniref:ABC transporter substrate-binding protein n=1 Tax=Bacillus aquiflavi TaxID=2672567 RepID=A0A6B3VY79_9BACI|nr:ABC transporter substrate-binding protein [Bacillus aquiflavi]MBA4536858.1 ABC transporter substrate-binding protein [Bacillus aquiflavi]NEY81225.1 ABC transporter substrate-binding protein [Bacillus aquiflavi]UAC48467.1 ABC transporter substrate-binding protein [Bacillus aquiflavi]
MKKYYSFIFVLLLSFGLLVGCNSAEKPKESQNEKQQETNVGQKEEASFPVTIKDGDGNEVVIEEKPEKIISLMPSNTEIAFALGLGDHIVGVNDYDNYPEEALEKEKIGGMDFNIEKIISLKPNLVLAHASNSEKSAEGLQQLRNAGITVLVVNDAQNFDKVYESIQMIGKATGETEEAEKIIKDMKDKVSEIKDKTAKIKDKKKVFIEVAPAPEIFTPGKNTFMDEMIQIVNAENAAKEQEGWVQLTEEAIIELNPDVIVTTYGYYVDNPAEQVLSREGWKDVPAVKNQQVVDVHADIVNRSGPRLAEGVEQLAKAIYPDVFKE